MADKTQGIHDAEGVVDHHGNAIGSPDFVARSLSEALEHCRLLSVGWTDASFEDRVELRADDRGKVIARSRASRNLLIRGAV